VSVTFLGKRIMSGYNADWYPGSRDGQIHLTDTWRGVFSTKAEDWGIPAANVTSFGTANTNAKSILAFVKSGARTSASIVQCNVAFKELETEARYIKKHWLLSPPLTPADLAMLLLIRTLRLAPQTVSPCSSSRALAARTL
jgi:hypothetical protein